MLFGLTCCCFGDKNVMVCLEMKVLLQKVSGIVCIYLQELLDAGNLLVIV